MFEHMKGYFGRSKCGRGGGGGGIGLETFAGGKSIPL